MITEDYEAVKINDTDLLEVKMAKIMCRIQSYTVVILGMPVSESMTKQLLGDDRYTEIAWLALGHFLKDQDLSETLEYIRFNLAEMNGEVE